MTPKTISIKKWIYILPTNLGILLGHLLCLSLSKLLRNWIWDTSINLKQNFEKLAVVLHVLQTMQNWSFHDVVLPRTAKKCTKIYNAHAQPLFCSLKLLFSDVPVAVAVVAILNSLKWQIASLSCHQVIKIWKQTWWSNDKTIIELDYRKISWFVSVLQIVIFCSTSSNNC